MIMTRGEKTRERVGKRERKGKKKRGPNIFSIEKSDTIKLPHSVIS